MNLNVKIEGGPRVLGAIKRLRERAEDPRPFFPLVIRKLDSIQEQHFLSEGASGSSGPWKKLNPDYARRKKGKGILRFSDALMKSVTNMTDGNAITEIRKDGFSRGSKLERAKVHQEGEGRMPQRKIYDLTTAQEKELELVIFDQTKRLAVSLGFEVKS